MKHLISKIGTLAMVATLVLLLQGFSGIAQTAVSLTPYQPGSEIAQLKIDDVPAGNPVTVRLRSESGHTLYLDKAKTEQYTRLISFANLNNGKYLLDLEQAKGITRKILVKSEEGLSVQEGSLYFQNTINFKEDEKRLVVRFNNTLNEEVTIRIVDLAGKIVHEESSITSDKYANIFNLSALAHGTYRVKLINGGFSTSKSIQL